MASIGLLVSVRENGGEPEGHMPSSIGSPHVLFAVYTKGKYSENFAREAGRRAFFSHGDVYEWGFRQRDAC